MAPRRENRTLHSLPARLRARRAPECPAIWSSSAAGVVRWKGCRTAVSRSWNSDWVSSAERNSPSWCCSRMRTKTGLPKAPMLVQHLAKAHGGVERHLVVAQRHDDRQRRLVAQLAARRFLPRQVIWRELAGCEIDVGDLRHARPRAPGRRPRLAAPRSSRMVADNFCDGSAKLHSAARTRISAPIWPKPANSRCGRGIDRARAAGKHRDRSSCRAALVLRLKSWNSVSGRIQRARILGLDQVVKPFAAQLGQDLDGAVGHAAQRVARPHADFQIGAVGAAGHHQGIGVFQSGQLQHRGLAGIAFQHRDMAALAGGGIRRVGCSTRSPPPARPASRNFPPPGVRCCPGRRRWCGRAAAAPTSTRASRRIFCSTSLKTPKKASAGMMIWARNSIQ